MEKWKNIKRSWEWLIKSLPKLLTKNGQYLYFGQESDCTPYAIFRARMGWRDCWIIADTGEDSTSIVLECSENADGYVQESFKDWLWNTLGLEFDEPIYVCEHIMGQE